MHKHELAPRMMQIKTKFSLSRSKAATPLGSIGNDRWGSVRRPALAEEDYAVQPSKCNERKVSWRGPILQAGNLIRSDCSITASLFSPPL